MSQGGNSNSGFNFGGQRYSPGYSGYSQGGMPPGGASFNQDRATSGVNPYGGMRPWTPQSQPQQPPYMPPEDFGGSMAKPMQIPGMPQQSSMGRQPFGGQTGGMAPYTPPQQPTMAPQNMGGQPQTGGDFTINAPGKIGYAGPSSNMNAFADPNSFTNAARIASGGKIGYQDQKPMVMPGNGMQQPNAFGGQGTGAPYDPRTPNYQPGAGWQTMLRQYAMGAGQNPNQYVQDRGMNPMWGNQQQSWEPNAPPSGMGLSELLQRYRGQ